MINIDIDFSKTCGQIKDVNCVNNGPVGTSVRKTSSFDLYENLEIQLSFE